MASPLPTPALLDELVEEILIRIPPDEPERLLRAAVVCKGWCRLVSGPGFRHRFRQHHGTPPMLGVIRNCVEAVRFVPTCSFRPPHADRPGWEVMDSRHGRVLLYSAPWKFEYGDVFSVWDPVTDERRQLPALPQFPGQYSFKAAVLCAARGSCDHLDCANGPFLVVLLASYHQKMFAYVYSSEAGAWSEPTTAPLPAFLSEWMRTAHVRDSLYFALESAPGIIGYDLGTREMTLMCAPPTYNRHIVLTTALGGGLGCATAASSKLCIWSGEAGPSGDMTWTLSRSIEFGRLIPDGHRMFGFDLVTFEDGSGVVYMATDDGAFVADLKSGRSKKVEGVYGSIGVPFMSFYAPGTTLLNLSFPQYSA